MNNQGTKYQIRNTRGEVTYTTAGSALAAAANYFDTSTENLVEVGRVARTATFKCEECGKTVTVEQL